MGAAVAGVIYAIKHNMELSYTELEIPNIVKYTCIYLKFPK